MALVHGEPVAIVTGGAQGLGLATAGRLLRDGYRVAIMDIQPELSEEAKSSLTGTWQYFSADISDRAAVQSISDATGRAWGRVDVLINNAGIFPRVDSLAMTDEEWDRILKVNLGGTFLCCQVFGRGMLDAGSGVIVNTASGHAIRGAPRGAAYAASKAAIIALTRSLASEWAPTVRVNCVVPGITDTAMPRAIYDDEGLVDVARKIPLGRVGTPDDVASAVSFLVSADASYITGQCLAVNGGALML